VTSILKQYRDERVEGEETNGEEREKEDMNERVVRAQTKFDS